MKKQSPKLKGIDKVEFTPLREGIEKIVFDNWPIMKSDGLSEDNIIKEIVTKIRADPELVRLCNDDGANIDIDLDPSMNALVIGRANALNLTIPTPTYEPDAYFDEHTEKFLPGKLARDMAEKEHIITIRDMAEEIVYFKDGMYHKGDDGRGDSYLRGRLKDILGERIDELSRHTVAEFIMQVRLNTYELYSIFEPDLELLPVKNGVLNLITGTIVPYDPDEHHFLFQLPVIYDPEAGCPCIEEFFSQIVDKKDVPVIQEIFGYCLWRDYYIKKALMMVGDGDNGKSVLMDLLDAFLGGDNVSTISLTQLTEGRFSTRYLRDKMANIFSDLPERAVKETGKFKMLTGRDKIDYEIKHGGGGQFLNYAKIIFSTNTIPDARDDKGAYFGRWLIMNCPYAFVKKSPDRLLPNERLAKDKDTLLKELTTRMELSGLLNYAIIGLKRLRKNGKFSDDRTTEEIRRQYDRSANSLKAFANELCTPSSESTIDKDGGPGSFRSEYLRYCDKHGLIKKDPSVVGRELPSIVPGVYAGKISRGGDRIPVWYGIRLKTKEDIEEESDEPSGDLPEPKREGLDGF